MFPRSAAERGNIIFISSRRSEGAYSYRPEEDVVLRLSTMSTSGARIVIDVGGTKFLTLAPTLTSNSTYFASLLGGDWKESSDDGLYLDRDPVAFGKLLDYMRQGMMKIEDIDTSVLILAEFLGLDRLLLAVKVRWYCNIGKGPVVVGSDEAIAAAFDEVHGGILNAISSGLFPFFLTQNKFDAEKDLAVMTVYTDNMQVVVQEIVNNIPGPTIGCGGIFGALNGIHRNGFTSPGKHLRRDLTTSHRESISFSRRRHCAMRIGDATSIFIPPHDESRNKRAKQFAAWIMNEDERNVWIIAPGEYIHGADNGVDEVNDISNPYIVATIQEADDDDLYTWLERHNFTTSEPWILEYSNRTKMLHGEYINFLSRGLRTKCTIEIYSRTLSAAHQEK